MQTLTFGHVTNFPDVSKIHYRYRKLKNFWFVKNVTGGGRVFLLPTPSPSWEIVLIISAIIEQSRIEKINIYLFFADAVKCFDKLWLQDCVIQLAKLGYNKNDLEILYKLNETALVKIKTPYGDTENIGKKEVVKQGTTFGQPLCAVHQQQE